MLSIIAFVLLSLVVQATEGDACLDARERTESTYSRLLERRNDADAVSSFIEASVAERECIGRVTERTGVIVSRELWAMSRQARYQDLINIAEELLDDLVKVARPSDVTYVQQRRGAAYFQLDRYAEAARAYYEAVRVAPPDSRSVAYLHLASLLRRTHRLDDALAAIDSATAYASVAFDPWHESFRSRVHELDVVTTNYLQGGMADAVRIRSLLEADDEIINFTIESDDEQAWISTVEQYGTLHLAIGDTARSNELIGRLKRVYSTNRNHATAHRALGAHAMIRGDQDAALRYFNESLVWMEHLSANNRVDVLTSLGDLHFVRDEVDEALHYYLAASDHAFAEAGQGVGSDLTSALFQNVRRASRRASSAFLERGEVGRAFEFFDLLGARYLNALRGARREAPNSRAGEIQRDLANLRASMIRMRGDDLIAARARESALVAELDQHAALTEEVRPIELDEVQARLRSQNQVMLVYLIDDNRGRRSVQMPARVFVVTPDTIDSVPLDVTSAGIASLLRAVSPVFETGSAGISEQAFDLRALHELYRRLVAPVAHHLHDGVRLVIIPDGPLFHIPFGMLVREPVGRFEYERARYLLHDHAISTELAPSLFVHPGGDRREQSIMALAMSRFQSAGGGAMVDLPATRSEVRRLQSMFANVTVHQDAGATPTNLFAGLREASVLHVATHATLDPGSHLNHAIILSPEAAREDGTVYMFDLIRQNYGTPFVALTGCATAAGPIRSGDGMAGFQYAFRAANVGSVLSTHWLVDDGVMAEITDGFYRGIADGLTKDEALRRAQLAYAKEAVDQRASPFFWAAPVLYGDASAMQFTPAKPVRRNIALSATVLLALIAVFWIRRRSATANSSSFSF
jgi:CHAT domain-containing protein